MGCGVLPKRCFGSAWQQGCGWEKIGIWEGKTMKKRRWIAMTLAAAMISGSAMGVQVSAESEEPLKVWVWDPAFSIYTIEEAEKIYQREHPEFSLDVIETTSDDVETKIMTMVEAGNLEELPDIFCLQDSSFQKMYENYPEAFSDLTDTNIDYSNFIESKVAVSEIDGKHWGIPFDTGTAIYAVRTDYLEEAGYTVADVTDVTWDEFIEVGKVVREKTGHPMLSCQVSQADLLFVMMQSAGQSIYKEDGSIEVAGNELLKQCIEIYRTLVAEGIMVETNSWDQMISTLNSGESAGIVSGCWILASIQLADDQSGKWAVTNIPSLPGVEGATHYSNLGGSTWVISSNCRDKEAAADFFATTFGGNVELFETVFPSTGLISPAISVGESGIYDKEQEFFGGQKVFQDITEYAEQIPGVQGHKYHYEARDAIGVAMQNAGPDGDLDAALQEAQDEIDFKVGAF